MTTACKLTVLTLKPGHLEEDYPMTMFSENNRFSSFLQTDQGSTMQTLNTLKQFELT